MSTGRRTERGAAAPRTAAALAGAAALLGAVLAPAPVAAQQGEPRPAATGEAGRGWLGVGLISFSECLEGAGAPEDECRHRLVVGGLVHGGPAHRAGLQPGDTLLAIDGRRLERGVEDRAFDRIAAGDTVSLLVGRAGGRVRLRAAPVARPDSLAIVQHPDEEAVDGGDVRYLLAVPERPVLDSLAGAAGSRAGGAGRLRISVVPAERVRKIPLEPEAPGAPGVSAEMRERLRRARARARELQARAMEEAREVGLDAAGVPEAPPLSGEEWKQWVSEELQPRLQVIYDSVLEEARDRMDSLDPPPRAAAPGRAPEPRLPPSPEELGMPGNRIAGAELQPLNPGLAEFFGGVERGLVVLQVLPGTPAARLGLRPGDVVVEAAGRPVARLPALRHALMEHPRVELRWLRRGQTMVDTLRH